MSKHSDVACLEIGAHFLKNSLAAMWLFGCCLQGVRYTATRSTVKLILGKLSWMACQVSNCWLLDYCDCIRSVLMSLHPIGA